MRIDLKCGEYLNFHDIKRVEIIDNNVIKIKGNFGKGLKSVIHETYVHIIKNIREFNRFLKKEMNFFQVEGTCPHCNSLKILELGDATYIKSVNQPKYKTRFVEGDFTIYKCEGCGKAIKELKPINLVIYTK